MKKPLYVVFLFLIISVHYHILLKKKSKYNKEINFNLIYEQLKENI